MVEIVIVILLVGLVAVAIFPLLKSIFESWEIADRRQEIIEINRDGMSQTAREIRRAWDLDYASQTNFFFADNKYIDFYPVWASSTEYRFEYATSEFKYKYGTTNPTFSSDTLSYPVDSFIYYAYNRRVTHVTRARTVNAIWYNMAVSDERRVLPTTIDPRNMRTMTNLRIAREGYYFAKSNAFASQSYNYDKSNCDQFCVKVFSDRIESIATPSANALVTVPTAVAPNIQLTNVNNGDYYWGCAVVGAPGAPNNCAGGGDYLAIGVGVTVTIHLSDGAETLDIDDRIKVQN